MPDYFGFKKDLCRTVVGKDGTRLEVEAKNVGLLPNQSPTWVIVTYEVDTFPVSRMYKWKSYDRDGDTIKGSLYICQSKGEPDLYIINS